MIDLTKHFTPKNVSIYILGDFNFPNIDWIIQVQPLMNVIKVLLSFV